MHIRSVKLFAVVMMMVITACSSGNESLIKGKWSISGPMIAGSPSSLWFKMGGRVVGPWEPHSKYMESSGKYELINDTHLKIRMDKGYYNGNVFHFDIIKLDDAEMVLQTNFQEIKMRKADE